ncbi:hypothetical protein U9M48_038251 [Paspalum notatum var. saurae]|uniref:Uncharacterized protein n=1 Tax=Paspalum notatum var. saurae TaxID=547442 RepID=A0AAQ3UI55_PASNO
MAQWSSSAGSLGRWAGPWRCGSPLPPCCRAPAPRPAIRRGSSRVGCATVPRELGAAAEAARPEVDDEEAGVVVCEGCGGAGWRLCDFCQGKKNNVKSEGTRVYRRCPTCKAAGFILCPSCRVYKCVTFPESSDS